MGKRAKSLDRRTFVGGKKIPAARQNRTTRRYCGHSNLWQGCVGSVGMKLQRGTSALQFFVYIFAIRRKLWHSTAQRSTAQHHRGPLTSSSSHAAPPFFFFFWERLQTRPPISQRYGRPLSLDLDHLAAEESLRQCRCRPMNAVFGMHVRYRQLRLESSAAFSVSGRFHVCSRSNALLISCKSRRRANTHARTTRS